MSTFKDEDPQQKNIRVRSDSEQKTPFDKYVEGLNTKYVKVCEQMAQQTEYDINIREGTEDVLTKFRRKHLTQGQLDEIENLRVTAEDLRKGDRGTKQQREANTNWYKKIGGFILYNTKAGRMMNEDDFMNAVNKDIKPILDGCIMAEMAGVPN